MRKKNHVQLDIEIKEFLSQKKIAKAGQVIPVSPELLHYLTTGITDGTNTANAAKMPDTILDTAKGLVYGDRNQAYGHPSDNFNNIAELFNAYLHIMPNRKLSNIDIAILNILQKIARLATNQPHRDSIVDIAGYAATIERIVDNK